MQSPESLLRLQGLSALSWDEVLSGIERQLTPLETQTFRRLHGAFAAYPTAHTVRSFYDFAASRGLLPLLACYRFERLVDLAASLCGLKDRFNDGCGLDFAGKRVLDYGAGSGALASVLRDLGSTMTVTDFSQATLRHLEARGFHAKPVEALADAAPFDCILCADSLGEIHADEDDWLADPAHLTDPGYAGELEARYGFAEKAAGLRPLLAPGGSILLYEPVTMEHFWHGAAQALEAAGWTVEVLGLPARGVRMNAK